MFPSPIYPLSSIISFKYILLYINGNTNHDIPPVRSAKPPVIPAHFQSPLTIGTIKPIINIDQLKPTLHSLAFSYFLFGFFK